MAKRRTPEEEYEIGSAYLEDARTYKKGRQKGALVWRGVEHLRSAAISYGKQGLHEKEAEIYEEISRILDDSKDFLGYGKHFAGLSRQLASRAREGKLEKATATAAIAGILGGIFFLSTNITGNAIADMTTKTTSFLGAGLLIVGLVAGFFWLKGRRK
jgi:hypothetical protein